MSNEPSSRAARLAEVIEDFCDNNGIEQPALTSRNVFGDGPIHMIAGRGEVDLLEMALASGEDIHLKGEFDWTPLHLAVCCKQWAMVEKLIELGADPFREAQGEKPSDILSDEDEAPDHIKKLLGAATAPHLHSKTEDTK